MSTMAHEQPDDMEQRRLVQEFFGSEVASRSLLPMLRNFVRRAGLAQNRDAAEEAAELLQDVAVQALRSAAHYDPKRQLIAWLLGIARNLVAQRKVQCARHHNRTISNPEQLLEPDELTPDELTPDALFDSFAAASVDPEKYLSANQQVAQWLALVSGEDRLILRQVIFDGMSGIDLSRSLGISPGAARARWHRASHKLRAALRSERRRKP